MNSGKEETQVDVLLDMGSGLVLLQKTKEPENQWRLPGGTVDEGENLEEAALKRVLESTGLNAELIRQFHTYSYPNPAEGGAKVRVVFLARARGNPKNQGPALESGLFHQMNLPDPLAWKHKDILSDYFIERY
jgi:ADP-ribose pyrophosphatase YjhB (NUDIX family)